MTGGCGSWVRCSCCGKYVPFFWTAASVTGQEGCLWIDGKPYCQSCARLRVTEALSGKGKARSGHET